MYYYYELVVANMIVVTKYSSTAYDGNCDTETISSSKR